MHRWWFTTHPPLPLSTRFKPPRFLVPRCRLERDHKRPIVAYSEVLNAITDEEWSQLKLPPVSSVYHSANLQLADLACPNFLQKLPAVPVDVLSNGVAAAHHYVGGTPGGVVGKCTDQSGCLDMVASVVIDEVPAAIDVLEVASPSDGVVGSTVPGLEMDQCHPHCFPGIGGELICLICSCN